MISSIIFIVTVRNVEILIDCLNKEVLSDI